jgi:hypothetical protein
MFHTKSGRNWLGATLLCTLAGCASSGEQPDQVSEALGPECANASATAAFIKGISVTSPQTYDAFHCFKGQVYDVSDYDGNVGAATAPTLSTVVKWVDATPAVGDCANAWVASDLFQWLGGWQYLGSQSGNGLVKRGVCWVPSVLWTTEMQPGQLYRVTASARTFNVSSAATRMVQTQTLANGVPDKCLGENVDDSLGCTTDSCSPASGAVTHQTIADGSACCSRGICQSGACVTNTGSGGMNGGTGTGFGGAPCN